MSIYRPIWFVCDKCGQEINTDDEDFESALDSAKFMGFKAVNTDGDWEHYCENCC